MGLTQAEFGAAIKVNRAVINKYEHMQVPPIGAILAICQHFKLDAHLFCTLDLSVLGIEAAKAAQPNGVEPWLDEQLALYTAANEQERLLLYKKQCLDYWAVLKKVTQP